jgi:hypothetical protein
MSIYKEIPTKSIKQTKQQEVKILEDYVIVTEENYETQGEKYVLVREVDSCNLKLNEEKNTYVVVKSMTNLNVYSELPIDEEFDVVEMQKGACVEFKKMGSYWYILSSDGLKNS